MIQGICFDLDGVLIHTDELHYLAWKGLAGRLGVPFSREQGDRCRGVSRMQSLEIVLEHAGRAYSQEEKERFAQEKNEAYRAMLEALSPADVISVDPLPDGKSCRVVVPDDQLSLAIGKEGQNARLAAKLTGFKIDIKPASAPLEPIEEPEEDLFAEEAPAEEAEAPAEETFEAENAEAPEEA